MRQVEDKRSQRKLSALDIRRVLMLEPGDPVNSNKIWLDGRGLILSTTAHGERTENLTLLG